ncbi:Rv3235 family protein [Nocardia sp. NPDC059180]|uniref:Rv3235 family protein n=1 Tax=Nocardia sp. NPDC059180 TaxID=3346761 RepID=UPI003681368D
MKEARPWLTPIPRYEPPVSAYVPDKEHRWVRAGTRTETAAPIDRPKSAEATVARAAHGPSRLCHSRPVLRKSDAARAAPAGVRRAMRGACSSGPEPANSGEAREFAGQAVRVVLEVVDGRRPFAHLATLADPVVAAAVRTVIAGESAPGRGLGVAVPARVRVMMVDERTAEICGTYTRGEQTFVMAGRIARRRGGWQVTALRLL